MYQREAMWMTFSPIKPCAVKVSVGGINALTGTPREDSVAGKQDYLALGDDDKFRQLWLDGVATAPGIIRQFVAVPLGHGATVEGQITGHETQGGIQFDVFPLYDKAVHFRFAASDLDFHKTPRQLGISAGQIISMTNKRTELLHNHEVRSFVPPARHASVALHAIMYPEPRTDRDLIVRTSAGETVYIPFKLCDTIEALKEKLRDTGVISGRSYEYRLEFDDMELSDRRTCSDYHLQHLDKLELIRKQLGGGGPDREMVSGIGVGGRISQKINKDPLPITSYDLKRSSRLHVTIINASHFTAITGLPTPRTPVDTDTYLENGYPWYELYDEHIPRANLFSSANPLSQVKSVKRKMLAASGGGLGKGCWYCSQEMTTVILIPCGHQLCNDCSSSVTRCPACGERIVGRKPFAAQMAKDESDDGVEAGSLDERIIKLRLNAGTNKVTTFKLRRDNVSPLTGDGKD